MMGSVKCCMPQVYSFHRANDKQCLVARHQDRRTIGRGNRRASGEGGRLNICTVKHYGGQDASLRLSILEGTSCFPGAFRYASEHPAPALWLPAAAASLRFALGA